jgi:hypothetical protein
VFPQIIVMGYVELKSVEIIVKIQMEGTDTYYTSSNKAQHIRVMLLRHEKKTLEFMLLGMGNVYPQLWP